MRKGMGHTALSSFPDPCFLLPYHVTQLAIVPIAYAFSHQVLGGMSRLMRKPTICIGENKDADQLRGYQRLCFRYTDDTIPLLSKSKISSL